MEVHFHWVLLLIAAVTIPINPVSGRQWTSRTGKFKTEAELVRFDGTIVHLRKADSRTVEVNLKQLCLADRLFLWTTAPHQKLEDVPSDLQAFVRSMHLMRSVEAKRIEIRIAKLRQHLHAGAAEARDPIGKQAREKLKHLVQQFNQLESPDPFLPRLSPQDVEVGQIGKLDDDLKFTIQADSETSSRRLLVTLIELRYINRLPGENAPKLRNSWHKASVLCPNMLAVNTVFVQDFPENQLDRILDSPAEQKLRSEVYRVVGSQRFGAMTEFLLKAFPMDDVAEWMEATTSKQDHVVGAAGRAIRPGNRQWQLASRIRADH